ncbi:MAG: lipoprotein [Pseudomonadota bacterium]
MRLFFVTFLLAYLLSACGHKGPLYIPLPQTDEANRTSQNEIEKK